MLVKSFKFGLFGVSQLKFYNLKFFDNENEEIVDPKFRFAECEENNDILIFYTTKNTDKDTITYYKSLLSHKKPEKFIYEEEAGGYTTQKLVGSWNRIFIKQDSDIVIFSIVEKQEEKFGYTFVREFKISHFLDDLYDVRYNNGIYFLFGTTDAFLLTYSPEKKKLKYIELCCGLKAQKITRILYFEARDDTVKGIVEVQMKKLRKMSQMYEYLELRAFNINLIR